MTINSDQIDLNADVGMFDLENDVVGFNPSESNVTVGVSNVQTLTAGPINDKVWGQMVFKVADDRGVEGWVERHSELVVGELEKNMGCDVMINESGKEGFDRKGEFVGEVNYMEVRSQLVDGGSDVKADCFSNRLEKDGENRSMTEPSDEDRVVCGGIDKVLAFELNNGVNDTEVSAGLVDGGSDVKADYFSKGLEKKGEINTMTDYLDGDRVVHRDIDRGLVFESNDGVKNELQCDDGREVTEDGPISTNVQLNKEDRVGFYPRETEKEVENVEDASSNVGNGNGPKHLADEIVNEGAGVLNNSNTIMGGENKIEIADNMAFKHSHGDSCEFGTGESTFLLQDGVPDMEVEAVNVIKSSHHKDSIASTNLGEEESLNGIKQLTCEIRGKAVGMQKHIIDINIAEPVPLGNNVNVGNDFNLVVDIGSIRNLQDTIMDQKSVLSELNFCVSDLVWGKVRGHPWWPGQILDPSAASAEAKRHFKKDRYLIAYYGDQSFAWNGASRIKPFLTHFSQLEKQVEKQHELDYFHHAVNCALDEVSRRVEYGLSCRCMPRVFSKIQTQIITNAGIQKQSRRRDGDRFLNAISFEPVKLIKFIKSLAQSPHSESDRLDFVIARAQLLAFFRSKGHSKPPEFIVHDGLCENDKEILLVEEEHYSNQIGRKVMKTPPGFSHKHKDSSGDSKRPGKKQRKMSELMSLEYLHIKKGKHVLERKAGNKSISSSWGKKRKAADNVSDFYIHKSQNKKLKSDSISPNQILSQLCLAAINPSRENFFSSDMVSLFVKFRDTGSLDDFPSSRKEMSLKQILAGETGVSSTKAVANMAEPCQDSYWTDRIIQSIPEQQSLFQNQNGEDFLLKTQSNKDSSSSKPQEAAEINSKLDFQQQHASREDICPTALILKFTSLDSVPSETKLNNIFERFGPLIESETKLLKKSNRVKVVFKRANDAMAAFSSSGKYSIFGPALSSYCLKKLSSNPDTASDGAREQGSTSVKGAEA